MRCIPTILLIVGHLAIFVGGRQARRAPGHAGRRFAPRPPPAVRQGGYICTFGTATLGSFQTLKSIDSKNIFAAPHTTSIRQNNLRILRHLLVLRSSILSDTKRKTHH